VQVDNPPRPGIQARTTEALSPAFCCLCVFSFLAYLLGVPITIEFPDLETQTSFNLARWKEILADPELAKLH
jgi:hypothetical protein